MIEVFDGTIRERAIADGAETEKEILRAMEKKGLLAEVISHIQNENQPINESRINILFSRMNKNVLYSEKEILSWGLCKRATLEYAWKTGQIRKFASSLTANGFCTEVHYKRD